MKHVTLILLTALLAGCVLPGKNSTRHVIIGFGIVSVPRTNVVASVTKYSVLGFKFGPESMALGYSHGTWIAIDRTITNLVLEIK